jgi:hypothetical protein
MERGNHIVHLALLEGGVSFFSDARRCEKEVSDREVRRVGLAPVVMDHRAHVRELLANLPVTERLFLIEEPPV